jgi:hypothetical protein
MLAGLMPSCFAVQQEDGNLSSQSLGVPKQPILGDPQPFSHVVTPRHLTMGEESGPCPVYFQTPRHPLHEPRL